MMKKILIPFLTIIGILVFSQNQFDIGKIQLAISFSENQRNTFDNNQLDKIQGKLTHILSTNGIVSTSYNTGLVLQPNLIINANNIVEGGMQDINVTNITLQLLIKQDQTNIIFSSFSKELKGTGRSQGLAINNAINSLSANDTSIINFIEKGKEKLHSYYQNNCSKIIYEANNLNKSGKYEESLALLLSIPESTSCFGVAKNKSLEIYKNYEKKICSDYLKQANVSIAEKDYSSAFQTLLVIDNSSPCSSQINTLIKTIENKINADEKKQWDMQVKVYNDSVSLDKHRLNAIKDIAVSYYKSQQKTNNLIIIK